MTSRDVIRLVAGREINQRLRAKSFYISTGLLVALILAVGVITRLAGGDDAPAQIEVAVVADVSNESVTPDDIIAAVRASAAIVDRGAMVEFFDDLDAAQAALKNGDFDVVIGGRLFSDAMGDTGTPEGTYAGMVRYNIDTIVSSLRGEE